MNVEQLITNAHQDSMIFHPDLDDSSKWTVVKDVLDSSYVLVNLFELQNPETLGDIEFEDASFSFGEYFEKEQIPLKSAVIEIHPDIMDQFDDEDNVIARYIRFDEDGDVLQDDLKYNTQIWFDETLPGSRKFHDEFEVCYGKKETTGFFIDYVDVSYDDDDATFSYDVIVGSHTIEDECGSIGNELDVPYEDIFIAYNSILLGLCF